MGRDPAAARGAPVVDAQASERQRLGAFQRGLLDALIAEGELQRAWAEAHLARHTPALFAHFGRRRHGANVRAAIARFFPALARTIDLEGERLIDLVRTNPTSLSPREAVAHWAVALERLLRATLAGDALMELLRIERAIGLARAVPLPSLAAGVECVRAMGEWPEGASAIDGEGLFLVETRTNVIDIYAHYPVAEAVSFGPPRHFAFFSINGGEVQRIGFASARELVISLGMHGLLSA